MHSVIDRLRVNDDNRRHPEDVAHRLAQVEVSSEANLRPHAAIEVEVLLGICHLLDLSCKGASALTLQRLALPIEYAYRDRRSVHDGNRCQA